MTQFAIFATLLVIVAAAFILPPLWLGLRPLAGKADRKQANLAIFRDQLAELEREKSEGSLAESDFEQAKRELQRRLLEEVEPDAAATTPGTHVPSRKLAVAILVLMPVLAVLGYGMLGNPNALDPTRIAAPPQMTQE
ncbi:MAG: c-type cytochrome biogenesis protein CcmI, partial [Azonexus sp.]